MHELMPTSGWRRAGVYAMLDANRGKWFRISQTAQAS